MGNYYKGQCFPSDLQYFTAVASDCPAISSDGGYLLGCSPSEFKIVVTKTLTKKPYTVTSMDWIPSQIACDPDLPMLDSISLAWAVIGVWVVAWTFKAFWRVIR